MDELMALNYVNLGIAMAVALAGTFTHYIKKWLRGETDDGALQYLLNRQALRYSAQTMLAVIAAVGTLFLTGQVDVSTIAGLSAIFTIGYTCDNLLNKDSIEAGPCQPVSGD